MYREKVQGWIKSCDFIILELISFQVAFLIACFIRHGFVNPYTSVLYRSVSLVGAFAQICVIIGANMFKDVFQRGLYRELLNVVKTAVMTMALVLVFLFSIQQTGTYSRIILITHTIYYILLAYMIRIFRKSIIYRKKGDDHRKTKMILLASSAGASRALENLLVEGYRDYTITGIILIDAEKERLKETIQGIPVVACKEDAFDYLCHCWVDEVFLELDEEVQEQGDIFDILTDMNMVVHVHFSSLDNYKSEKKIIQNIGNNTVVTISSNILRLRDVVFKRFLDIIGGLLGCVLTGILVLFLAPAIYVQSPGPIFFKQLRVGRNGKLIYIYKFRSMYLDAEERKQELLEKNTVESDMMFKMENDPRIIGSEKGPGKGIGNFIRSHSLDEFPQFFNVLKGDMSLVGTRPPTVDEWEKYEYHHRGRLSITPGLTGLWQVSGRSDITDFEEVVRLDKEYISKWSVGLDFKILLKTIAVIFGGGGAR